MYKKILRIILALLNFSITFIIFLSFLIPSNTEHTLKQVDISNNYTAIGIPFYPTNQKDYDKLIDGLNETSKKVSVPFLKKLYYEGTHSEHVNYFFPVAHLTYEVSNLPDSLISENFDTKFKNRTYSTYLVNAERLKKYNLDITVRPITRHSESFEGTFYIERQEDDTKKEFIQELRRNLNKKFNQNWTLKDFEASEEIPVDYNTPYVNFTQLIVSFTIFSIIFLIVYTLSFSYEIGIYRLHGQSILKIVSNLFSRETILGLLSMLLLSVPLSIHYELFNYISLLAIICSTITLVECLIAWIIVWCLSLLPVSHLLKRLSYHKAIFHGLFLTKGLLIFYLFFSCFSLFNLAKTSISYQNTSPYSGYASFYPLYMGYNSVEDTQKTFRSSNNVLKQLLKDDSLYIDTLYSKKGADIIISANYLKFNPINDINNKTIKIPSDSKDVYILVSKKNKSEIKKIIQEYYQENYNPAKKVKVIPIKNNQPITKADASKIRKYRKIIIFSYNTISNVYARNWGTGQANDQLKIPLKGRTPKQIYQHYYPLLKKYNLIDNYSQVIKSKDANYHELANLLGSAISDIFATIISLLLFALINISVIYLYFSIYGRKIAIMESLGYSSWRYLKNYWSMWLRQLCIVFLLIKFLFPFTGSVLLIGLVFLVLVDLIINCFATNIFSRTILRRYLNE